ncbi:MAG: GGDEF domain-containing protein [Lachnospiraceae bacterium]|nr:GGDEF domain-containing protein [Lachnospiraceae bacterium]
MKLNDTLYHEIINASQDCIFWKDRERRFLGANQAFLDFYGFESVDVIIGRTDEDMGWHSDPVPFMADELRVLEGQSTYKVPGRCTVHGEERSIVASKRPLYDGDKIVGIVGSFSDVTHVLRKKPAAYGDNALYDQENLSGFQYFEDILKKYKIDEILDPLTGVIRRQFITEFARSLTGTGTAFSVIAISLDNIKYINDAYGHEVGENVRSVMAARLARSLEDFGVAGRLHDDELILINMRDISLEERKAFLDKLYAGQGIARGDVRVDDFNIFVSATCGCAVYPNDASDCDELFMYADKALRRGCEEGGDRYVIYDDSENKEGGMDKLKSLGIYTGMQGVVRRLERTPGFEDKLRSLLPLLKDGLKISKMFFADSHGLLRSIPDSGLREDVSDITYLLDEAAYSGPVDEEMGDIAPMLHKVLENIGAQSVIIARVGLDRDTDGYLVCTGKRGKNSWSADECGLLYFAVKLLAMRMRLDKDEIPE